MPQPPTPKPPDRVQQLPIELIRPGPAQARARFDPTALAELAASVAESGVIQPIVVRGDATAGYQLLAGERRWRAAQQAGLEKLPAVVRNDLSDEQAAVLGLIENLQRESLSVMETAHGLARLAERYGITHEAIARRVGKSRAYVSNFLRLRHLDTAVQTLIDDGRLSLGHAKTLAGVAAARQPELARRAVAGGWNVRRLERAARELVQNANAGSADTGADLSDMERQLSEHVGNAVTIRFDPERRRGELRIAFHDLDEFDGLLARLGYRGD